MFMGKCRFLLFAVALGAFSSHAADLKCQNGRLADISGEINTKNIFMTRNTPVSKTQSGEICLVLADAQGVFFNKCGGILGTVLRSEPSANETLLTHVVAFGRNEGFLTHNDRAISIPISPAAFNVQESITQIKNGKGLFTGAKARIAAQGTISFSPNSNHFILSGSACLKKKSN
jgi:hypothetical protein